MLGRVLTKDEIKKIKDGVVVLTVDDVVRTIASGKIKIIEPVILNNGYSVGYSIDHMRPNLDIHHISVCNQKGITDPAEAEQIATDFLGNGYKSMDSMNLKNVLHFIKILNRNTE